MNLLKISKNLLYFPDMKNLSIRVHIFTLFIFLLLFKTADGSDGNYTFLWGGFSTSLRGRSAAQTHNTARAARDLEGAIIPPGGTFSFNDHVGSRDRDKGYVFAPMINKSGNLEDTPGGGICQLATTIYNAALYAGLKIVERHPHSRAVFYVPPGRDATIATWRKDLKLRNPFTVPVMLRISITDARLTAGFWSIENKPFQVEIRSDCLSIKPETVGARSVRLADVHSQNGGMGFSVVTRRLIRMDNRVEEQILSRDFYPPPTRILAGVAP
jgi:vancomycin resistance protein VanW